MFLIVPMSSLTKISNPLFRSIIYVGVIIVTVWGCEQKQAQLSVEVTQIVENPAYDKAFEFREAGNFDSALAYFYMAKNVFEEQGDSLGVGKCLSNVAMIMTGRGDYYGAQELGLEALNFFNSDSTSHHHYLGSNYNNLGIATHNMKDYENAIRFYNSAIAIADDSLESRIYLNNLAVTYQKIEDYSAAIHIYEELLNEEQLDRKAYARLLSNYSYVKWLADPTFPAFSNFMKALHIRMEEGDTWGQNASYAHLAEFYTNSRPDSAKIYALKRYEIAKQLNSAIDQVRGLEKLIEVSGPEVAKHYFTTYQRLNDSLQLARTADKNQHALIRYEVEKNRSENLQLQQENQRKAFQLARQRIVMIFILVVAVMAGVWISIYQKRRKIRLELEAQNRIQEHKLKTSKKIHDVVANGLYRVMNEIEHKPKLDKEELLDKLEVMYEKSRDISHGDDEEESVSSGFHQEIKSLVGSFYSTDLKIVLVGSDVAFWEPISSVIKKELLVVIQELLVNMRKHSEATIVVLKFGKRNGLLSMEYRDNGVGVPAGFKPGKGMHHMENRVNKLGGTLTYEEVESAGTVVSVSIPI